MNDIKLASLDLAKNNFQLCLIDTDNLVVKNQKISRSKLLDRIRQLPANTNDCDGSLRLLTPLGSAVSDDGF